MSSEATTTTRAFRIVDPADPARVIRGRLDGPAGFESARAPLPHVVVIHGFKGFMSWGFFPDLARAIARAGWVAVRFDMSGSGVGEDLESFTEREAFARNTISRELEDLERVRAWIRDEAPAGIDRERSALVGHSRGGGIALLHGAEHRELASIVAWAAIDDVDRFDEATKALWRERGSILIHNARTGDDLPLGLDLLRDVEANRARFDVEAACRRLRVPTLLVHGELDEVVPLAGHARLARALDPDLHASLTIPATGHTFGVGHPPPPMRNGPAESDPTGPLRGGVRAPDPWAEVRSATLEWIGRHWS